MIFRHLGPFWGIVDQIVRVPRCSSSWVVGHRIGRSPSESAGSPSVTSCRQTVVSCLPPISR